MEMYRALRSPLHTLRSVIGFLLYNILSEQSIRYTDTSRQSQVPRTPVSLDDVGYIPGSSKQPILSKWNPHAKTKVWVTR